MVGISSGMVTKRKSCQVLAPSIELASYSSGGMDCKPANRIKV